MMKNVCWLVSTSIVFCQVCFFANAASVGVPGTGLSIHVGEGGSPVRQNGPVFKSPGEILTNVIAGAICGPLCVGAFNKMSPADKQNAVNAVSTVGFVVVASNDPVLGLGLALLTAKDDGGGHEVTVSEKASAATGKVWTISTDCIVQRQSGAIMAFTVKEYAHHGEISRGDTIKLSAPICAAYNQATTKSVTSININVTGLTTDEAAKDGDIKYYITGNPV